MKCSICGSDSTKLKSRSASTDIYPDGWLRGANGNYCPICIQFESANIRTCEDPRGKPNTQPTGGP